VSIAKSVPSHLRTVLMTFAADQISASKHEMQIERRLVQDELRTEVALIIPIFPATFSAKHRSQPQIPPLAQEHE
jgi:hypothetical protein